MTEQNTVISRIIPDHLLPDKSNQFLCGYPNSHDDEWMVYDSWNAEIAVKLITIGYPVDFMAHAEMIKDWPDDAPGRYGYHAMLIVYSRARNIAESSIAAGKIKNPDTPLNWIAWAKSKGYNTAHLDIFIPKQSDPQIRPIKLQAQQEDESVRIISEILGLDPLRLPKSEQGKRGVKADVLEEINKQPSLKQLLNPYPGCSIFKKTWERLLEYGRIKYQENPE